jgi:DNA polymerase II large subunit
MSVENHFASLKSNIDKLYSVANEAKKSGKDFKLEVESKPAADKNNRCIDILAMVYPELDKHRNEIIERILKLEKKYGVGSDEVALKISKEIATGKFFKFSSKEEAILCGLRFGCAYNTKGVVGAPIEGITNVKIDPKENFLYVYYAGPIRTAGGTAQVFTLFIADYIRKALGVDRYYPTKQEIERYYAEIIDYIEYVTRKQYRPNQEEVEFLVKNVPICITGEPTEQREVSKHKDLERAETTRIRGGMCLVYLDGLPLKAKKLVKKLKKYGDEFGLTESWNWLEDFLKLKKSKEKSKVGEECGYKFLEEVPAGRPVYSMPTLRGGFRLRYGRSRNTGVGCFGFHPVTLEILDGFPAVASQMKIELPGKGCTVGVCDYIESPIVKLKNGDIVRLTSRLKAREIKNQIDKILFVGDVLISYGDFAENGEKLIKSPYVEEWWVIELEEKKEEAVRILGEERVEQLIKNPKEISEEEALILTEILPLHPKYIHFYDSFNGKELAELAEYLNSGIVRDHRLVLNNNERKKLLEKAFIPHEVSVDSEYIILEEYQHLLKTFEGANLEEIRKSDLEGFELVNKFSKLEIRDKVTKYIGARMGRPEKAHVRKMKGSPQVLFPVGEKGGRMRNLVEVDYITTEISEFNCSEHGSSIYPYCLICGKHLENPKRTKKRINALGLLNEAYQRMNEYRLDLIKGIKGVTSKHKVPEPVEKGILRAKNGLYVFRDGTIRFDMVNAPLTHFKPKEIGTSVEKLKELGYTHDIYGKPLENEEQILELFPQDFIISTFGEESAADYFLSVAKFVDEELVKFYGTKPFYNAKTKEDLIGHLFLDIAPHTISPVVCRLIGFTSNRCHYAHPYLFAGTRRDCFFPDEIISIYSDKKIKFVEIGKYVEKNIKEKGSKIVDNFGTRITWTEDEILTYNGKNLELGKISVLSKHKSNNKFIKIKTKSNREIITTKTHNFFIFENGLRKIKTNQLKIGQNFAVPLNLNLPETDLTEINLAEIFKNKGKIVIRGISKDIKRKIPNLRQYAKSIGLNYHTFFNYFVRESIPLKIFNRICKDFSFNKEILLKKAKIGFEKEKVSIPAILKIDEKLLYLIGFYIAEGHARKGKRHYQVNFAVCESENRRRINKFIKEIFGVKPYQGKDNLTLSGKLIYYLFEEYFSLGSNAHNKSLESFMLFPKEKIKYILQGYFDGDGSTDGLRVRCSSSNKILLKQIELLLLKFGIFSSVYFEIKAPKRGKVADFYLKKGKEVPNTKLYYLNIQSSFTKKFRKKINFRLKRKKKKLEEAVRNFKGRDGYKIVNNMVLDPIVEIKEVKLKTKNTYCLTIPKTHNLYLNWIVGQCDGEENGILLMLDCLLNFSKEYLPEKRGSISDAPLSITTILDLGEVDDEVYDMDIAFKYPKEFYEKTVEGIYPWEFKIEQVGDRLKKGEDMYSKVGYTLETHDVNKGVHLTKYKRAGDMIEKVMSQLKLAQKLNCVDESLVAFKILSSHFLKDLKGNLRTFFKQTIRCTSCNSIYRRAPLSGRCTKCGGNLVLTVSEGTISKYLEVGKKIAEEFGVPNYTKEQLKLLQLQIENVFGKKAKQSSLTAFS